MLKLYGHGYLWTPLPLLLTPPNAANGNGDLNGVTDDSEAGSVRIVCVDCAASTRK